MSLDRPTTDDRAPRDARSAATLPFVSVIVPVRNEARYVGRTLGQLLAQDYDPQRFEIIVADGDSTDGTATVVRELAEHDRRLLLVHNPRRLASAGRNLAIRRSRGDVVVVVDGHCQLDDNQFLQRLVAAFEHSGASCVGRPQPLEVPGAAPLQRAIAAARRSWLGHHPDSHVYSSAAGFVPAASVAVAYRREVFEHCGYFDEQFDACEDVEFNRRLDRAGLTCYFTPEVRVRYYPRASLAGLWCQMVRYGRGRARLLCKDRGSFSFKTLLPAAFVAGCVLGAVLAWLSSWLMAAYLASLAAYGTVVVGASLAAAIAGRDPSILTWLPAVFVVVHAGAGAGILQEGLTIGLARACGRRAGVATPSP